MRKITQQVVTAFLNAEPKRLDNTSTDGQALYLHGNKIAERRTDGSIWFTFAGWATRTTSERINGLLDALGARRVNLKNYAPQWNGQALNSSDWYKAA
jgi:hypothetical protein